MANPAVVRAAIDEWYSANYPSGVRLTYNQREALAALIVRRLGLVQINPITEDGPSWRVNR